MLEDLTREQQMIILGLVLLIVSGLAVTAYRRHFANGADEAAISEPLQLGDENASRAAEIVVHVSGAVKREGVYRLKLGDRTLDALKLAGGPLPSANLSILNLAEKAKDGQKIIVPQRVKIVQGKAGDPVSRGSGVSSGKVSINTAAESNLCKVRGIGPSTAKKIIEHRSTNGPFSKIEDIMKVKGIGKGKFEKIREQITI